MIKKVIIGALALVVTAGSVSAQTTQFGVKGGVNLAKITDSDGDVDAEALTSFNAGLVADIGITEMFSVRTGLELQGKGSKNSWSVLGVETVTKTTPLYLEIPATFTVNFPLGGNTKLYAGAGPYVAFGVGGKHTVTTDGDEIYDDNIEWGNDNDSHYKRVDGGLNVAGGVTFNNKFGIHTQYGIGLVNINSGTEDDSRKFNNRVFGLSGILYF